MLKKIIDKYQWNKRTWKSAQATLQYVQQYPSYRPQCQATDMTGWQFCSAFRVIWWKDQRKELLQPEGQVIFCSVLGLFAAKARGKNCFNLKENKIDHRKKKKDLIHINKNAKLQDKGWEEKTKSIKPNLR